MTHADQIEATLGEYGFTKHADVLPGYYKSRTKREQKYLRGDDSINVRLDGDDRLVGFGYTIEGTNGYADTHREGRHLGVWRPYFGAPACMKLLFETAAKGRVPLA